MAIAVTVTKQFDNGQSLEVLGTFTASGNYATPGDAVSWASTNIKTTKSPLHVDVYGIAGYVYIYDIAANKLKVYTSGANAQDALAELSNGAYGAPITGDTIRFRAIFQKNI